MPPSSYPPCWSADPILHPLRQEGHLHPRSTFLASLLTRCQTYVDLRHRGASRLPYVQVTDFDLIDVRSKLTKELLHIFQDVF